MPSKHDKPPAFQFYVKSWMSSTKPMSLEVKGAYIDLLAWAWDNGPLPLAEDERATLVGLTPSRFRRVWQRIASKWVSVATGFVNLRLEQQRDELEAYREGTSERGKKGAEARWHKHDVSIAADMPKNGSSSSTASSSSIDQVQELKIPGKKRRAKKAEPAYTPEFKDFWRRYPRRVKKESAFAAWVELAPSPQLQAEIFDALTWQVNQPAWHEDGGKWTPHPASWINARRWEDEPFNPPPTYVPDTRTKGGRTIAAALAASEQVSAGKRLLP